MGTLKVLPGIKIAGFTHEFRTVQCFLKVKCVTAVSTELKSWAQTSQNIGKIGDKPAEDIIRQIWFAVILWLITCEGPLDWVGSWILITEWTWILDSSITFFFIFEILKKKCLFCFVNKLSVSRPVRYPRVATGSLVIQEQQYSLFTQLKLSIAGPVPTSEIRMASRVSALSLSTVYPIWLLSCRKIKSELKFDQISNGQTRWGSSLEPIGSPEKSKAEGQMA